ncbi:MAG: hypothetical protein JEZ07_17390 [Phycisphaerae bacterium]|nr:hypothetical protein [Phycisphaerae bacterium]
MKRKFKSKLEEKANELSQITSDKIWERSIPATIRREIALTVNQIEQLKKQHAQQFHELLKIECYVNTELKQLKQSIPWYTQQQSGQNDKLHQRLFDIEKERRALSLKLEEKTRGLEDKLLELVNRHEELDI